MQHNASNAAHLVSRFYQWWLIFNQGQRGQKFWGIVFLVMSHFLWEIFTNREEIGRGCFECVYKDRFQRELVKEEKLQSQIPCSVDYWSVAIGILNNIVSGITKLWREVNFLTMLQAFVWLTEQDNCFWKTLFYIVLQTTVSKPLYSCRVFMGNYR